MESREGMGSGITVIGAEAPSAYHVAPRVENPNNGAGSPAVTATPISVGMAVTTEKKKRGRPRKYGPDGAVTTGLSPSPISSSAPPAGDFSGGKRGRGRPSGLEYKKKVRVEHKGDLDARSVCTSFLPHCITVNAGEDITMKVISLSQDGPRAICILSATGTISSVTIRQHDSSGGSLTYEGRFEILSLCGSFVPVENQGTRSRSGGLSISLTGSDGRVIGGVVAGLMIAASPVKVVVGSFLSNDQQDLKPKKQKPESIPTRPAAASAAPAFFSNKEDGSSLHGQQNSSALKTNFAASSSFQRENWPAMHSLPDNRNSATDINISLPGN